MKPTQLGNRVDGGLEWLLSGLYYCLFKHLLAAHHCGHERNILASSLQKVAEPNQTAERLFESFSLSGFHYVVNNWS